MTIQTGDIKLMKSQVMLDTPDGGGAMSNVEVIDGQSNNVFPDVSELDRTYGRIALRKVFPAIQTTNNDAYFGAHAIISKNPADPYVSATMFTTKSWTDRRDAAADRVETYLSSGPKINGYLLENHVLGQKSIQIFQRPSVALPTVGKTLLLVGKEGLPAEYSQYVRITRVTAVESTFTYNGNQDYQALVVTCDISDPLRFDFAGSAPSRTFTQESGKTVIRDTLVANAAVYYGCSSTVQVGHVGEFSIKVKDIFSQLVPSAQTETPALDQKPAATSILVLAESPRKVEVAVAAHTQRIKIAPENRGFNYVTILKPLPAAGSVSISYRALGNWYTIKDNGDGTLSGEGSGTVNYLTGSVQVTLTVLPDVFSNVIFNWADNVPFVNRSNQGPSVRPPEFAFSLQKRCITPNSFSVSWTSNNVVKNATDNGLGKLTGDAVGEIVYASGEVFIRPNAMIDAGGEFSCTFTWNNYVMETKTGLTPDNAGIIAFTVNQEPVPGTLSVEWMTVTKTSSSSGTSVGNTSASKKDNASSGMIVHEKTYMEEVVTGLVQQGLQGGSINLAHVEPISTPTIHYKPVVSQWTEPFSKSSSANSSATYSQTDKKVSETEKVTLHSATDGGGGSFYGTLGSINYAGKSASIRVVGSPTFNSYESEHETGGSFEEIDNINEGGQIGNTGGGGSTTSKGGNYGSQSVKESLSGAAVIVSYTVAPAAPQAGNFVFTVPATVIDLAPYTIDRIQPGSVLFTWMGHTYQDFEGKIYRDRTENFAGFESGTLDYSTGLAVLTDYVVGPGGFTLQSLWTTKTDWKAASVYFRTQLSPIKPSGLTLSVTDVTGQQIIAQSQPDGTFTGNHILGRIDYETGVVELLFGDYVLDAGLTPQQKAEWWYAGQVPDNQGKVWKPWPVDPTTLRYNAVSYSYLPLDAEVLGLDAVRLPSDGRVPIFRKGDVLVIHNTQNTPFIGVPEPGMVLDVGRVRLSYIKVKDANGTLLDPNMYTNDLLAGTVTLKNNYVLGPLVLPLIAEHRVDDMALCTDLQINGKLSLNKALTHEFPALTSNVSSALIFGNGVVQSRVYGKFSQQTWTDVWSDSLIGNPTTAQFNDVLYPITTNNKGAIQERWALIFTSATNFRIVGETVGQIGVGDINNDLSPPNPSSGQPYWNINKLAFGLGWAAGNVIRFTTAAANYPLWLARTILQGPGNGQSDRFQVQIRGDIDN
ncbi:MAG: hypothetical protein K1X48_02305 [Burkholderiaceae bacterium]|nr:hypothetical protein [Burkholderiaceae bacterium]